MIRLMMALRQTMTITIPTLSLMMTLIMKTMTMVMTTKITTTSRASLIQYQLNQQ